MREMFVPLSHPPGHAQADFGEAKVYIAGVERKAYFFVMVLPHSDKCFAYDGSLVGRPCLRLCLLWRGAAIDPL